MLIESMTFLIIGIGILLFSIFAKNLYALTVGICFVGLSLVPLPYAKSIFYMIIGASILLYIFNALKNTSNVLSIFKFKNKLENSPEKRISLTDPITDVYSKDFFEEYLKKEIEKAKRYGKKFSILLIDLNDLHLVNNKYGHLAGDQVLKSIAKNLSNNLRDSDVIARWNSDDFVVLLSETSCVELLEVIDRLYNKVKVSHGDIEITLSIGFSCYPEHGQTIEELMQEASRNMYRAKNMYKIFSKIE